MINYKIDIYKGVFFPAASFSETFYGLKRIAIRDSKGRYKLTETQEKLSLILIVLFPYLKNKLLELSQRYKLQEIDGHVPQTVNISALSHCTYNKSIHILNSFIITEVAKIIS